MLKLTEQQYNPENPVRPACPMESVFSSYSIGVKFVNRRASLISPGLILPARRLSGGLALLSCGVFLIVTRRPPIK